MARKRKAKRTTHRRRRTSIGAVGGMATEILGVTAGAVVAGKLISMLSSKVDSKIAAAGAVALGVFLPKFVKSPMIKGVANGMIAVGGQRLVANFLPALGATDDVVLVSGYDEIGGLDQIGYGSDLNAVNGSDISEINGYDEY